LDTATLLGLVIALGALGVANHLEGGTLGMLVSPSAALIVFGGSLGAAIVMQPLRQTLVVPLVIRNALFSGGVKPLQTIQVLGRLARVARREGVLALESELGQIEDASIRRGLQLVVDGTDPEVTQNILEIEIDALAERHASAAKFFTAMGGLTPTLGVTGTVMGLVNMLRNLSDPGTMGPAIATAFLATLYGVASANLIFLPIAEKLKMRSQEEQHVRRMVSAGIEGLQAGDSPIILVERLKAFLSPREREAAEQEQEDNAQGGDVREPVAEEA